MPVQSVERKLAAIFAADIAGYSRLMGRDEVGTLARLKACRAIIDDLIASHRGRIFNTAGDSVLADFASAVDAVHCAVAVQEAIATENAGGTGRRADAVPHRHPCRRRHRRGRQPLGDGVNIAARLEGLAEPGGICVSAVVPRSGRQQSCRLPSTIWASSRSRTSRRPVRVYRVQAGDNVSALSPSPRLPLPDKPSIAVLPFQNMSGDPEQEYFADGMVEEIITALSRIRWLFVIARNSTFTYKGQAVDVKQVGRELGVRYVLEGSVRKGGNRVRITAQLIDAADRHASVGRPLRRLARRRVRASGQGRAQRRRGHRAGIASGRDAPLRRAADDRPHRLRSLPARACGLLSNNERADFRGSGIARTGDRDRSALRAGTCPGRRSATCGSSLTAGPKSRRQPAARPIDLARQALQVAENDPGILANAALVLAQFGEDIGAMIGLVDRALALNPSFARGWYCERRSQDMCRSTRSRDRACRDLAAPEPARAYGSAPSP